ncbi:uncharacterized protein LOC124937739 [Impatiens glandulifera]|uniref:uncharacterized protein LOC124937739 n=1 Tax=Impatiens glandulifera TaxID=253017 RepID=UPI001FB07D79|nr:uncharacterized protein LOC124937739 [Impatiens glandulifera]
MNFFMTAAPSPPVSLEEFKSLHSNDRDLYAVLINELGRDSLESMRIMALWLWLERSGFRSVVKKALSLPKFLINELANEAVVCLKLIENNEAVIWLCSPESIDLSLTKSLVYKEISAMYFHENRVLIVKGTTKIIMDVCVRVMKDIMEEAMERNLIHYMSLMDMSSPRPSTTNISSNTTRFLFNLNASGSQGREEVLHPDERTMFMTFSKGYPVTEMEIKEFFTWIYGDCIESLYMQEVLPGEQSLFARIVFYLPVAIDMILNGADKAKFTINGKHMWIRKFVSKRHMYYSSSFSSYFIDTTSVPSGINIAPYNRRLFSRFI